MEKNSLSSADVSSTGATEREFTKVQNVIGPPVSGSRSRSAGKYYRLIQQGQRTGRIIVNVDRIKESEQREHIRTLLKK